TFQNDLILILQYPSASQAQVTISGSNNRLIFGGTGFLNAFLIRHRATVEFRTKESATILLLLQDIVDTPAGAILILQFVSACQAQANISNSNLRRISGDTRCPNTI